MENSSYRENASSDHPLFAYKIFSNVGAWVFNSTKNIHEIAAWLAEKPFGAVLLQEPDRENSDSVIIPKTTITSIRNVPEYGRYRAIFY